MAPGLKAALDTPSLRTLLILSSWPWWVADVDLPTSADSLVLYKQGSGPGTGVTC